METSESPRRRIFATNSPRNPRHHVTHFRDVPSTAQTEQLERIEELDDAWQHGKFDIKWVCESFKPYWRNNKLFTPTERQINSNRRDGQPRSRRLSSV